MIILKFAFRWLEEHGWILVRATLPAFLVLVWSTPTKAAAFAYVVEGGRALAVIDVANNLVTRRIELPGPGFATAIVISPDGSRAYVADQTAGVVLVIDLRSNRVSGPPIMLGGSPYEIAVSPTGRFLYVTHFEGHTLSVIDLASSNAVKTVEVGVRPRGVAVAPNGKRVYVAHGLGSVSVIDTQTHTTVGAPIAIDPNAFHIVVSKDSSKVYISHFSFPGAVTVIDTSALNVLRTIAVQAPFGLALTPNGRELYVVEALATVAVVNTTTDTVADRVTLPRGSSRTIGITTDGRRAYVGVNIPPHVLAIDTATRQVVGDPITLSGRLPGDIAGGPMSVLRVDVPNTYGRWGLNTRHTIAWTYTGDAPQFLIEISRNSGRTWDHLRTVANEPGGSQDFDWVVTGPLTSAAKFRVTAMGDPEATDVNDADIRIANAAIEILSPTQTTSVATGATLFLHYRHSLGARARVAIDVSADNGATWKAVSETTTTGSTTSTFRWIMDLLPTSRARVRVRALDGSGAINVSRAFSVTAPSERFAPASTDVR
jgi:YVTN family beta-propeller protein